MTDPVSGRHYVMPFDRLDDPCEWNPDEGRACYEDEAHARAEVIVGANGRWRLCTSCAKLPEFRRFRVRLPIVRAPSLRADLTR